MLRRLFAAALLAAVFAAPAPADDPRPLARVAFGCCADQDKPCPIWQSILDAKPELLVLLGDTIYADLDKSKPVTPEVIKSKYDMLDRVEPFRKLKATVPLIGMYDDHDYGKNDGDATWPLKDEAQRLMLDFYGVPADSPRRARKGCYHAEVYGPPGKRVQVILLDGRYYRTPLKKGEVDPRTRVAAYVPTTDPAATMLGEDQWAWLAEQLRQPAELRLIGSGVQVLPDEHPFEKWANYPRERERLYRLIRDTRANGVVILSGDRHLAELSVTTSAVGYPLYDVTSSGFNQATLSWRPPEPNRYRVAAVPYGNNFGVVGIDWAAAGGPRVSLEIRDEAGETLVRHPIRLGLLTPPPPAAALPAGVVGPAEAAKQVGRAVTVQFPVKSARLTGTGEKARLFLNSKENFRDEDNFTVLLTAKALTGPYQGASGETFQGKTVRVTGTVKTYQNRPEIVVEDAVRVEVVGK